MICSRDCMDDFNANNSAFQLFGADIMLDKDLKPWLIEINNEPSMETDTRVTSVMCPQVLDDVIKGNNQFLLLNS